MKKGIGIIFFALSGIFSAITAKAVSINVPITQFTNETAGATGPGGTILNFYWFALFISGILAFGAIVWGGVKYALAAGNPSGQSEGKEWIKGALIGMLLLAGAYIVLKTINPNLINLNIPQLSPLPQPTTAPTSCSPACNTGQTCVSGNCTTAYTVPPSSTQPIACTPACTSSQSCVAGTCINNH